MQVIFIHKRREKEINYSTKIAKIIDGIKNCKEGNYFYL